MSDDNDNENIVGVGKQEASTSNIIISDHHNGDRTLHRLEMARLLERTNAVRQAIRSEVDKENELLEMVERLFQKVNSDTNKRTEEGKGMEQRIAVDTSRSTSTKQLHEELTEEFMEFCKWHFVEPRFNIVWRALNKLGLYLRVFLSFIFVFPFIAIYSKALRFFRRRIRVKRSNSNSNVRPGWTIQRPYDSSLAEHDFGGGLAQLVSNPLRFSGHSLRDELESMGNFCSDNDESEDLRRFVVGSSSTPTADITPTLTIPRSKTTAEINTDDIDIATTVADGDVDEIEASSPPAPTKNEAKRRSRSRDKATARSKDESSSRPDDENGRNNGTAKKKNGSGNGYGIGSDKRSRSENVDVPLLPDDEEERAGWALQDNQESVWVDGDSQNSRDFWDSFGARSPRKSRS